MYPLPYPTLPLPHLCRRNVRYFYRRNVPSPNRHKISNLCRRNVRYSYRRKVASPNRPIAESSSRLDFHRRIGVAESSVAESASPKRPIPNQIAEFCLDLKRLSRNKELFSSFGFVLDRLGLARRCETSITSSQFDNT